MFQVLLKTYSLIYIVLGSVYSGLNLFSAGHRSVIASRLRLPPPDFFARKTGSGRRIWIHAVSVGEVNAVRPLADSLIRAGYDLLLSTTTKTGQDLAGKIFRGRARVFYFPVDIQILCRKWLRAVDPEVVLLVETEIWPNFITAARRLSIPLVLVNGRISDASFKNYRRFSFFFRPLLAGFIRFCMQSNRDKLRALELGADPARVNWVGNLKYDIEIRPSAEKEAITEKIGRLLKPDSDSMLWLCGSTKPGEEELLLRVYANLLREAGNLSLLIAPRHPERADEICKLAVDFGLTCHKRSALDDSPAALQPPRILVLDTIGELAYLYRLADVVFMGGSLVAQGGQNPLEPAAVSRPILFGPHMENFREIAESLVSRYAALQVASPEELGQRILALVKDESARTWLGRNARKVIRENRGAVKQTREIIEEILDSSGDRNVKT